MAYEVDALTVPSFDHLPPTPSYDNPNGYRPRDAAPADDFAQDESPNPPGGFAQDELPDPPSGFAPDNAPDSAKSLASDNTSHSPKDCTSDNALKAKKPHSKSPADPADYRLATNFSAITTGDSPEITAQPDWQSRWYYEDQQNGPTAPVDVPASSLRAALRTARARASSEVSSQAFSRTDDGSVSSPDRTDRRGSISFNPKVRLDSGGQASLEGLLPRPSRRHTKKKSVFEEIERQSKGHRAYSDADREEYDPKTGERLDALDDRPHGENHYTIHEPRWPLLQTTVDQLAAAEDQVPARTASPADYKSKPAVNEPPAAAIDPSDFPASTPAHGTDYFSVGSFDSPRRSFMRPANNVMHRSASIRAFSRRSTGLGAAVRSPSAASSFLSRYAPSSPQRPSSPDAEGTEVRDYVLGPQIGYGGFSIIREATTRREGKTVKHACKVVRRIIQGRPDEENAALQAEWAHEVELWRRLHHRHILPLYAVVVAEEATFAFTHLNTGGTLFDAVRNHRATGLPPPMARRYSFQLALALRHLHKEKLIVHRDLKLENCLLDRSAPDADLVGARLLLCDFGLADYLPRNPPPPAPTSSNFSLAKAHHHNSHQIAADLSDSTSRKFSVENSSQLPGKPSEQSSTSPSLQPGSEPSLQEAIHSSSDQPAHQLDSSAITSPPLHHAIGPSGTSTSLDGSLPYAAPELLEVGPHPSDASKGWWARTPVDLWAFGCVCFALVMGRLPFEHSFAPRVRVMILGGEWDRNGLLGKELSERNGVSTSTDIVDDASGNSEARADEPQSEGDGFVQAVKDTADSTEGESESQISPKSNVVLSPSSNEPTATAVTSDSTDKDLADSDPRESNAEAKLTEQSLTETQTAEELNSVRKASISPSPFLQGISELIDGVLTMEPALRWDIDAVLASRWLASEPGEPEDDSDRADEPWPSPHPA